MKTTTIKTHPQEIPDNVPDTEHVEKENTAQQAILSHEDAEAGSPFDNTGDEDPGAALEFLVS
ncbi:MAG: hypothetical protein Q7T48_21740 [Cellvibrio sp.]|uniref:hypothetical protein n=1 Tax=Cellvibrio sp. TaxID=1965322 RepID=UPI00271B4CB2|nr:hypothetical protein [Cellvibrio sp.]